MNVRLIVSLLPGLFTLGGCAAGPDPRDPMEPFNRKVYAFNETVDKAVLKPAAKGYVAVVPEIVRRGVRNVFNNVGVVVTALNDALQLKGTKVPLDVARFTTNLVFGLGGLIDVASELKIENRNEDFGQTLGYWGVPSGPYLTLPLLGASDVRDGSALVVDFFTNPLYYSRADSQVRWGLFALSVVDTRSNLLGAEKFLETAAVDRYSFVRDAYLQRREYLIHDGHPRTSAKPPTQQQKTLKELEEEDERDEPSSESDQQEPGAAPPTVPKLRK
ncbi:MAG: VacJ family lipoprotein [Burkholderiales bacterium]|jgi:phospholipid-binding lipoprotein MlaA